MDCKFEVKTLGKSTLKSPIQLGYETGDGIYNYIKDEESVLYNKSLECFIKHRDEGTVPLSFEKAGPREFIFFEPAKTKAMHITYNNRR